jgi:hypothetical protein
VARNSDHYTTEAANGKIIGRKIVRMKGRRNEEERKIKLIFANVLNVSIFVYKCKNYNIKKFACGSVWMLNLVSNINSGT